MRAITLFVQLVLLLHHPSSHGSLTYQNNHAFINFASPYIYLISGTINSCAQPSAIRANASFLICIYDLSLSFIIVHFNDTFHHPFIYSLVYLSNCLSIHSFFFLLFLQPLIQIYIQPSIETSIRPPIPPLIRTSIQPYIHPYIEPHTQIFIESTINLLLYASVYSSILFISSDQIRRSSRWHYTSLTARSAGRWSNRIACLLWSSLAMTYEKCLSLLLIVVWHD